MCKSLNNLRLLWVCIVLWCTASLSGCGGGGDGKARGISGSVVQQAIEGAAVFADQIVADGVGNYKVDTDEKATLTTTDENGHFTLPVTPSYPYVIVSRGGTDIMTGEPAIMMLAPAGASNISPLTTLVALNPSARAIIESLGVSYDANIAENVTPAALLLIKSVETIVSSVTDILNPGGNKLKYDQIFDIQSTVLASIAEDIQNMNAAQLTNPAELQNMLTSALQEALTAIDAEYDNITINNSSALASDLVDNIIPAVADAISPTGTFSNSSTDAVAEDTLFDETEAATVSTTIDDTLAGNSGYVTVTPPAGNQAPVISGTPATTVMQGSTYSFVPTASDPDGDTLVFSISNKPSWASFNIATGALTGTRDSAGTFSGIVITVSDGVLTDSLPAFGITVTPLTGGSGGGGGF